MRKFLLLVAAVAVGFLGGGTSAVAQELVSSVSDLANGDRIVLKAAASTCEGQYLNGASEKSAATSFSNANVYEVEFVAGSTTEIYLKQKSSGQYIGKSGAEVVMAADVANAAAFTIKSNSEIPATQREGWAELDETEKSQVIRFVTDGTMFLNTQDSGQKPKYATGTGNWSVWYVYKYKLIQPSTTEGNPEHLYRINNNSDTRLYVTATTDDTRSAAEAGEFAFYAVSGVDNAYYIYSKTASKWVSYTKADGYNNQNNFLTTVDEKPEGAYFYVENYAEDFFQIRPYTTGGDVADKYINWYQGGDANTTLGLWQQGGADDGGSRWTITDVTGGVPFPNDYYTLQCKKNSKYAYYDAAMTSGTNTILAASTALDARGLFEIGGEFIDGFTIRSVNNPSMYVYAINTNDADSNVGVKEVTGEVGDECKWQIVAYSGGYNIIPKNGANGWNVRGGNGTHIGQWSSNATNDNTWFVTTPAVENIYTVEITGAANGSVAYGGVTFTNGNYVYASTAPSVDDFSAGSVTGMVAVVTIEGQVVKVTYEPGLEIVGTYLLSRVGAYLNPLATGEVVLSAETKAKSVWKVEEAGAGYTVQNVLTGLYVNVNAGSFTLSETAQELALNIKEDVVEFAGMEWSAVKNDALVAEATTGSTKIQKVSEIAGMLDDHEGVPSVLDFLSVEDWNAYSPYQPFSGRYYRIYAVARDMYIGLDANGSEPLAAAGNEKNLEQVWQLVASGNGFKLCNPNMNAADATKGYLSAPNAYGGVHASMRAENGTLTTLYLDDRELTVAGAKFFISSNATLAYGANGRGENLNVEADGTITRWRGENAQFSAHRVKTWNVALASVGTNTYASVYLPFAVTVGSDVKAYVGDGDVTEGWLKIKEAVEVASGAGFILEGTGASATLTIGASDAAATSSISGTYRSLVVDIDEERASYLVLGTNAGDVGFYRMAGSLSEIPANKAYLEVVGGGAVKLLFPGMMTGVEDAVVVAEDADAQIFDLSGRKVLNPVKGGIYVKNGKKVIFK